MNQPTTDWKSELHKLQTKFNAQKIIIEEQKIQSEIKSMKERKKNKAICFFGWLAIASSFVIISLDSILALSQGTRLLSASYNPTVGLWQLTMVTLAFFAGIILLVLGR